MEGGLNRAFFKRDKKLTVIDLEESRQTGLKISYVPLQYKAFETAGSEFLMLQMRY